MKRPLTVVVGLLVIILELAILPVDAIPAPDPRSQLSASGSRCAESSSGQHSTISLPLAHALVRNCGDVIVLPVTKQRPFGVFGKIVKIVDHLGRDTSSVTIVPISLEQWKPDYADSWDGFAKDADVVSMDGKKKPGLSFKGLGFNCDAHEQGPVSLSGDLGRMKVHFAIDVREPEIELGLTYAPRFKIEAGFSGKATCRIPTLEKLRIQFPVAASPPIIVTIRPRFTLEATGRATLRYDFKPSLTAGFIANETGVHLTPDLDVKGAPKAEASASLTAKFDAQIEISLGNAVGVYGTIGPYIDATWQDNCTEVTAGVAAELGLKASVFFKTWTIPLAQGDLWTKDLTPSCGSGHSTGPTLGPNAEYQGLPAELDFDGDTLLSDHYCHGWVVSKSTGQVQDVSDDSMCGRNLLSGDGTKVFYAVNTREPSVSPSQPECPTAEAQGYIYRWNRSTNAIDWINLDGQCVRDWFRISENARYLVSSEGALSSLVLHDLHTGFATEISPPCRACIPLGVTNDGRRVVYDGPTTFIDASGHERDGQALFVWDQGLGARIIAGGDTDTYGLGGLAMSGDGSTVLYQFQPADAPATTELYRWTQKTGNVKLLPEAVQFLSGSISFDGNTAAISYILRDAVDVSPNQVGILRGNSTTVTTLAGLGVANTAQSGVVSGDGRTIAFVTTENLVAEDQDPSLADWYFLHLSN